MENPNLSLSLIIAKPGIVEIGGLRLPPGFRFHPTDEELVVQYLKKKALSLPLPANVIPEIELAKNDPWNLLGVHDREGYFFALKEAKRTRLATPSGYWKSTGKLKVVKASNQVVGTKRTLVFHRGRNYRSCMRWVMQEFRLAGSMAGAKEWVACYVFKKKKRPIKTQRYSRCARSDGVGAMDLTMQGDEESGASSPTSSCVTDLSEGFSDSEEGSSQA